MLNIKILVDSDDVYKSWVKSELYGGVFNGGLLSFNLKELSSLSRCGYLSVNEWKRVILLIKAVRGLYLIPDIVTGETVVEWYKMELSLDALSGCLDWKRDRLVETLDIFKDEDVCHNNKVSLLASQYNFSWKDEPLIFVSRDKDNFGDYRLIDGNHRARRYLRDKDRDSVVCYVGIV